MFLSFLGRKKRQAPACANVVWNGHLGKDKGNDCGISVACAMLAGFTWLLQTATAVVVWSSAATRS